ncbi:MAG: hypothetical protein PF503_23580 [Desulfobacula sp.]|nr:hypothetical protein [Desulfobacula sp.]
MEIERYKQKLELCFIEYETLQVQHIHTMKTKSMPDLAAMTEERDKAFISLKQNLDTFVGNIGTPDGADPLPELTEYQTRLSSIMEASEELSSAIQEYKDELKINLIKIQQGKTAMRGYKAANMHY